MDHWGCAYHDALACICRGTRIEWVTWCDVTWVTFATKCQGVSPGLGRCRDKFGTKCGMSNNRTHVPSDGSKIIKVKQIKCHRPFRLVYYSSRSTVATPLQPFWDFQLHFCDLDNIPNIKISYFRGFEISTQNVNFWQRFSGSGPMLCKQFQGHLEACLNIIKGPHKLNNNEACRAAGGSSGGYGSGGYGGRRRPHSFTRAGEYWTDKWLVLHVLRSFAARGLFTGKINAAALYWR